MMLNLYNIFCAWRRKVAARRIAEQNDEDVPLGIG
jgi:hypothetical protein